MTVAESIIIIAAGVGAGTLNAVVGAGTLVTFPVLLALGVPPVTANVSNTIGLVPGSVAGAYGFRSMLRLQGRLLRTLVPVSAVGGIAGGTLLLVLPDRSFAVIVPVLLVAGGLVAALQPRIAIAVARRHRSNADSDVGEPGDRSLWRQTSPLLSIGVALTGIYGGYFGAAQGVLLLALLGIFSEGGMTQVNGAKNVLAGVANLVSGILFLAVADVNWIAAACVALGATIGGALGGRYGRQLPSAVLRMLVVVVAIVAAVWQVAQLTQAY